MPFSAGTLVKVTGHENVTLGDHWVYREATETVPNIAASGYMNAATTILKNGDIVWIHGSTGTGVARVSSATGAATVTLAALTALV